VKLSGWVILGSLFVIALCATAEAHQTRNLERQLGPGVDVAADAETGRQVTFVGTRAGRTIPLAAGAPRRAAREAAQRFAPAFGLRGDAGATLPVEEVDRHGDGRYTVRFQQEIDGLPVIGGELVVNLDQSNDLLSIGGELEPASDVETRTSVSEGEAAQTARAVVAKKYDLLPGELLAGPGELSIYDNRILGGPGIGMPRPVWRFEIVDSGDPPTVRELVLIDAQLGNVALNFSEIHDAEEPNRRVCDAEEADDKLPCEPSEAARVEGEETPTEEFDVDEAYDLTGDIYDFYFDRFGRDSIDGSGLPLISTVNFCEEDDCPYFNAFWNGEQATYGPGMVTEDIAAHELTHGVTEHDSGLFYYYQSGAINESLSDVFGELFDLANGPDPEGDKWLIGEGSAIGVIRDMADPSSEVFKDPDKTSSKYWRFNAETSFEVGDAGGVHSNSGVNNKAAYLLTDGDSFNGHEIEELGEEKVAQIYYEVNSNMLTSASDYADLGNALRGACANLTGEHGITEGDCNQVDDAVLATEMDEPVAKGAPQVAQTCGSESTLESVFSDDLETPGEPGEEKWGPGGSGFFYYPQNDNPFSFDATYATSGTTNIWGYDPEGTSDSWIEMTEDVIVPPGGWMHFAHAYGFDSEEGEGELIHYDGGVVEYSIDGGAEWEDAGSLIVAGDSYSDTLVDEEGHPLSGHPAFAGESGGYGSTRLDLSSLADQEVRFRFRIGTDSFFDDEVRTDDYGWFIDDVQIYSCDGADPEDELPEEEEPGPEEPSEEDSSDDGDSAGDSSQIIAAEPISSPHRAGSSSCVVSRTRYRRARVRLRRSVRGVGRSRVAVRKARGSKPKAKAQRRLRGARKGVKRKRRAVRRTRARLRACLG
jgi:Zn-dependent metalloprotease